MKTPIPLLALALAFAPVAAKVFAEPEPAAAANARQASVHIRPENGKPGSPCAIFFILTLSEEFEFFGGHPLELKLPKGMEAQFAGPIIQTNFVNGERTATLRLRFDTSLPGTSGEYAIPAQTLDFEGMNIRIPETKFTVRPLASGEKPYEPAGIAIRFPNRPLYVGETVPVVFALENTGDERIAQFRSLQGDDKWPFPIVGHTPPEPGSQEIKLTLSATKAGKGRPRMTGNASILRGKETFGPMWIPVRTPEIEVRHTPEVGKPASYAGAVGVFAAAPPRLDSTQGKAGEPLTLSALIGGNGDLGRVVAPKLAADGWIVKTPKSQVGVDTKGVPAKLFIYEMTPMSGGDLMTPGGEFSWFNPVTARYETSKIDPISVRIEGPQKSAAVALLSTPRPALAPDPTPGGRLVSYAPVWTGRLFSGAQFALAGALLAAFAIRARIRWSDAHPEVFVRRRARREMARARALAKRALASGDDAGFAKHALTALRAGAAPFLEAEANALTGIETLAAVEPADDARAKLESLIATAEAVRFGDTARAPKFDSGVLEALFAALDSLKKALR